jgi:hypothetical protein
MGFVVDKEALGQVFSEHFVFSLSNIPPIALHSSSSGVGKIGHLVASVIVGLVPLYPKKKKDRGINRHGKILNWEILNLYSSSDIMRATRSKDKIYRFVTMVY